MLIVWVLIWTVFNADGSNYESVLGEYDTVVECADAGVDFDRADASATHAYRCERQESRVDDGSPTT